MSHNVIKNHVQIAEYDAPDVLLEDTNGLYYKLVNN